MMKVSLASEFGLAGAKNKGGKKGSESLFSILFSAFSEKDTFTEKEKTSLMTQLNNYLFMSGKFKSEDKVFDSDGNVKTSGSILSMMEDTEDEDILPEMFKNSEMKTEILKLLKERGNVSFKENLKSGKVDVKTKNSNLGISNLEEDWQTVKNALAEKLDTSEFSVNLKRQFRFRKKLESKDTVVEKQNLGKSDLTNKNVFRQGYLGDTSKIEIENVDGKRRRVSGKTKISNVSDNKNVKKVKVGESGFRKFVKFQNKYLNKQDINVDDGLSEKIDRPAFDTFDKSDKFEEAKSKIYTDEKITLNKLVGLLGDSEISGRTLPNFENIKKTKEQKEHLKEIEPATVESALNANVPVISNEKFVNTKSLIKETVSKQLSVKESVLNAENLEPENGAALKFIENGNINRKAVKNTQQSFNLDFVNEKDLKEVESMSLKQGEAGLKALSGKNKQRFIRKAAVSKIEKKFRVISHKGKIDSENSSTAEMFKVSTKLAEKAGNQIANVSPFDSFKQDISHKISVSHESASPVSVSVQKSLHSGEKGFSQENKSQNGNSNMGNDTKYTVTATFEDMRVRASMVRKFLNISIELPQSVFNSAGLSDEIREILSNTNLSGFRVKIKSRGKNLYSETFHREDESSSVEIRV